MDNEGGATEMVDENGKEEKDKRRTEKKEKIERLEEERER